MTTKVIIPYARNRIAYAILRSLSNAGYECYPADSVMFPMCKFSRLSNGYFRYPDYNKYPDKFINWCQDMYHNYNYIIFPTFMESWLLKEKSQILNGSVPSFQTIMDANDKWIVNAICHKEAIPAPVSQLIKDCVIKPVSGRGSIGRIYVDDAIIQKRVRGDAIGVGMLMHNDEVKAQFAWRRLKEFPADGGMSIVCESIHAPEHIEYAQQLLSAMKWQGVAMVEFKGDQVIEVNPRFWGSIQHAINCGVDFPRLLMDIMTTEDCDTILDYKQGIRTSWLAGCMRRKCLPKGHLVDFQLKDPLPFIGQFMLPLSNVLKGKGLVLDEN